VEEFHLSLLFASESVSIFYDTTENEVVEVSALSALEGGCD
jgi:hypothetical protein